MKISFAGRRRVEWLRHVALVIFALLLFVPVVAKLEAQKANAASMFSIRLEQRKGSAVQAVAQNTVFKNGDILRFRLTSQVAGYLYVVDKGTTGSTSPLFPATNTTNSDNRIEINRSYLVPADGDGWFEVSGPAGFDTLYFLVSSTPIALPPTNAPGAAPKNEHPQEAPPPPPDLLPRCDDAIFKARGECLDGSAGVAPLPPDAAVPRELVPLARTASRDIVLTSDGDDTAVQPAPTAKLPLIYTFRLAHRE
ncbi:MAG TPA: DUF4384 domain-containing protein [Terracidiphilus sp.]|jgi:hypothetical protein